MEEIIERLIHQFYEQNYKEPVKLTIDSLSFNLLKQSFFKKLDVSENSITKKTEGWKFMGMEVVVVETYPKKQIKLILE